MLNILSTFNYLLPGKHAMTTELDQLTCKYCSKVFQRLSTLSVHLCETKRRWNQETDTGVRLGLQTYIKFYELTQCGKQNRSYAEFVKSPYYSSFVKFGQYMVSIRAVRPDAFIVWIIKSGKKLDQWTTDRFYDEYLLQQLRTENTQDALERSIKEMTEWADTNNSSFNHFFLYGNYNKICQLINNGRISPWVIFNSKSGIEFLSKLNQMQLEMIYTIIDPSYWENKFKLYSDDTKWVTDVLNTAGL